MKKIKFLLFFAFCLLTLPHAFAQQMAPRTMTVLGTYSDIFTYPGEDAHQSGHAVVLYRRDDGFYFGEFIYATGATEAVKSPLINLKIIHRKISFSARTSAGVEVGDSPTKELFDFSGIIHSKSIRGVLSESNGKEKTGKSEKTRVRWIFRPDIYHSARESYEDYLKFAPKPGW